MAQHNIISPVSLCIFFFQCFWQIPCRNLKKIRGICYYKMYFHECNHKESIEAKCTLVQEESNFCVARTAWYVKPNMSFQEMKIAFTTADDSASEGSDKKRN